jgi:hypothetical protein
MNIKEIYKRGFVDGMRNCGFLLYDTKNTDIQLTDEWIRTIDEEFAKRQFPATRDTSQFHQEYKALVLQLESLTRAYETLSEAFYNLHGLERHTHLKE